MGLYPGDPGPPGGDCAGTVVSVGSDVNDLKVGDAVFGIAPGCLKTYVTTDARLMRKLPAGMSFEEASALPVVGATVELALYDYANVKAGDRVLIHAVTGGVGIAAVQLCQRLGAIIYGTCGSEAKMEYARSLGIQYVTSSRDVEQFSSDMHEFLGDDYKIDVVLNCLIDEFIPASLNVLGPNGRFMELGKRSIWSAEKMHLERPDVYYETIAVDVIMEQDPAWFGGMLDRLRRHVEDEQLRSLPLKIFDLTDPVEGGVAAFRYLQRAQQIGKVVVRIPSFLDTRIEAAAEDSTFIITGGVGGLGLVFAKWLAEEGVRNIVLLSRRPTPSLTVQRSENWQWLKGQSSALHVEYISCDVSQYDQVVAMFGKIKELRFPPVRGILHAAGITSDATLGNQTRKSIESVYNPKAIGAWNLHRACEELDLNKDLKIFMMFSSVSALLGNYGQANYAAANACLDALVQWRRSKGLCGQSIQWGPWLEQGMAADLKQHLGKVGMQGISNELGLRFIASFLECLDYPVVCVESFIWRVFFKRFVTLPSFYRSLGHLNISSSDFSEFRDHMSADELKEHVRSIVIETATLVLGSADLPPLDAPLQEIGIDSLAAVELRNELSRRLGVQLPATTLFDYPTINAMVEHIQIQVLGDHHSPRNLKSIAPSLAPIYKNESIAVIGLSCRLPGGVGNPAQLWEMLSLEKACVVDIPLSRFDIEKYYDSDIDAKGKMYARKAAFIQGVEMFDNSFFGLSTAEVMAMDPQQRHMLEVSYEAFNDAGYSRESLLGQSIGVWIGCCNFDWLFLDSQSSPEHSSSYSGTGGSGCLMSNRVSYVFGIKGPSMTIDTACSSSLVAIDTAVRTIKTGLCSGALVGGANLILMPHLFVAFCKARMLSPNSRCAVFDISANGYVRGEGLGAVVLRPLEIAVRGKNNILGIVRGSAVNHDGRSASLTAPNGPAQQDVIRSALQISGIDPLKVCFVEAHGTGTALGDPIEMGALKSVYGSKRSASSPLVIGAIKSYIGHLEGSSGIAGFIKLLLCLNKQRVPANLFYETPNPYMDIQDFPVVLPKTLMQLSPSNGTILFGGVSSFGFGGANAHVLVEQAPSFIATMENAIHSGKEKKKIAFLCTGQGSQFVNMCKQFYDTEPIFADAIRQCSEILREFLPVPLTSVIYPENDYAEMQNLLNRTQYSQPAIFAVEYGLCALLKQRNIIPDIVLGHSVGEYVAAVIGGIFSLEDGLRLLFERASIMNAAPSQDGVMAACRCSRDDAESAIKAISKDCDRTVVVGAVNGPRSIVLSGKRVDVQDLLKKLGLDNQAKYLEVSHAFHSPLMLSTVDTFKSYVDKIHLSEPKIPFASTVIGSLVSPSVITKAQYWSEQIIKPVLFYDALQSASNFGAQIFIEIGSQATLSKMGMQALPGTAYTWVNPCCNNGQDLVELQKCVDTIEAALSTSHVWNRKYFPWNEVRMPFLDVKNKIDEGSYYFSTSMPLKMEELFRDHTILGTRIMPGAGFVEIFAEMGFMHYDGQSASVVICLESLEFERVIKLPTREGSLANLPESVPKLCLEIAYTNDKKVVLSSKSLDDDEKLYHGCGYITGVIPREDLTSTSIEYSYETVKESCSSELSITQLYQTLKKVGLDYGPRFQVIRKCYKGKNGVLSMLKLSSLSDSFEERFRFHPALLDGAFQSAAVLLAELGNKVAMVPVSIKRAMIGRIHSSEVLWSFVTVQNSSSLSAVLSVNLYNKKGHVVAKLEDVLVQAMDSFNLTEIPKELIWETLWKPVNVEIPESTEAPVPKQLDAQTVPEIIDSSMAYVFLSTPPSIEVELRKLVHDSSVIYSTNLLPSMDEFKYMLSEKMFTAIIYLGGLQQSDEAHNELDCISELLSLCNSLFNLPGTLDVPPVFIITNLSEVIQFPDKNGMPRKAGVQGFVRSARQELESAISSNLKLVTMDFESTAQTLDGSFEKRLLREVKKTKQFEELEYLIKENGERYVSRLEKSEQQCKGAIELYMNGRGALTKLRMRPQPEKVNDMCPSACIKVRIRAVGLNFRDVLNVMGLYPGDPGPPGGDCAGTVVSVGSDVNDLKVGDAVFGIAPGCLKTYVTTDARLMRKLPAGMSFEEASALPVVGATVELALYDYANVKAGDRVLIHAVTGGVGIAAVQLCQRLGAIIYGTCGSEAKMEYARSLGIQYVTSSRDVEQFSSDMHEFLGDDYKIDVVLNCLIDEFIPASLNVLGPNGRFMELGKRSIWSAEKMHLERPDVYYETIAVDVIMEQDPAWFGGMLDRLRRHVEDEQLRSLPLKIFDLTDPVEGGVAAFRYLQRAQQIGKVVVRIPSFLDTRIEAAAEDSTFIITGGVGGLGLVFAKWLAEEGVRNIVLLSRRPTPSLTVQRSENWQWLKGQSSALHVEYISCDVSQYDQVVAMFGKIKELRFPPVRGILHAAGITSDATLGNQTRKSIESVYNPKAIGAWNLHRACEELDLNKDLKIFMMFSSVSALLGNYGQANYAAANACLDALVQWRRSKGLCGQSIQWGP
ncbi:putative type I fatty acid synthase, partial [Cardiosporidium cionae]